MDKKNKCFSSFFSCSTLLSRTINIKNKDFIVKNFSQIYIYIKDWLLFIRIFNRYINIQWTFFLLFIFNIHIYIWYSISSFFSLFCCLNLHVRMCVCVLSKRKSKTNKSISHCRKMFFFQSDHLQMIGSRYGKRIFIWNKKKNISPSFLDGNNSEGKVGLTKIKYFYHLDFIKQKYQTIIAQISSMTIFVILISIGLCLIIRLC